MSNPYQQPQGPYDPYGRQAGGAQPGYGQQPYGYPQQTHPQAGYQQQPPPGPYGYPGAPAVQQPNNLAVASVVTGFISIVGMCIPFAGLLGPVSLALGVGGLSRAKATGVGRNLAIGGVVVGSVATLILVAYVVFFASAFSRLP